MKGTKWICGALAAVMLLCCFVGCGDQPAETTQNSSASSTTKELTGRDAVLDTVSEDLNFSDSKDNTITFFVRSNTDDFLNEMGCEELSNNTLYDTVHYRNMDVENRLGVKIKVVGQDGSYAQYQTWNETLSNAVLLNTREYDAAAFYTAMASSLVTQGIYLDLMKLSTEQNGQINLEKPWWNQNAISELMVGGRLYFLGGDILPTQISRAYAIFFGKDMFDRFYPDEKCVTLYQLVKDKQWTIERMIEYVELVYSDDNHNGVKDNGDLAGFRGTGHYTDGDMDAWIFAMGLNITKMNAYGEPEYSMVDSPNLVHAFELVRTLHRECEGTISVRDDNETGTTIGEGNLLFYQSHLSYGETLRDSSYAYGVLPLPMYNEEMGEYRVSIWDGASMLAVLSNVSTDRYQMIGATLELMAAGGYKSVTPTYYSKVLQGIYSKDEPDGEMFDLITSTITMDFGLVFSSVTLGKPGVLFRRANQDGFDLAQYIADYRSVWENNLIDLLDAINALD